MSWCQKTLTLKPKSRGCYLITEELVSGIRGELAQYKVGLANIFRPAENTVQHSSASLTLNENYDPDVRVDMEMMLNRLVPEDAPYTHTMEGPDDMPGHVKSSLFGASLTIPIRNGQLALGTWQGRSVVITLQGEKK
ncbi:hypothetical protein EV182_002771 [Spiromyces aspiralis]|uniref:Uncharacterized protein n=1 Tax=Spiromyces aspiralis TaxID=68401 RepID=A0ACC1HRB3_9FUNG|nr:hypothetical protein EV182_002771 [Spiromyces aspiralis]